jgi:hypothetical protein
LTSKMFEELKGPFLVWLVFTSYLVLLTTIFSPFIVVLAIVN